MKFNTFSLYPELLLNAEGFGIIGNAIKNNIIQIDNLNLRDFSFDKRGSLDSPPYGGGAGMVLRVDVLFKALSSIKEDTYSIMLSASGKKYSQKKAKELSLKKNITIFSGKYEGFDERFLNFVDEEISLGDFVLSSGDFPTLCLIDSITRLLPGVLGNKDSLESESFENDLLEYPQYTRPEVFLEKKVPKILLSGNHKKIEEYRYKESLKKTNKNRKDLL